MNGKDFPSCRDSFPALSRTHEDRPLAYFDGPAGTQVPQAVINDIVDYYSRCNANAHGCFVTSHESDALLDQTRRRVAAFLNAEEPETISFGANMTSLNFALSHALSRYLTGGDQIVITQLDHEANRAPWLDLQEKGISVNEVPLKTDGTLDYAAFRAAVTPATRLVAIGWASNALGTVNQLAQVRDWTRELGAWLLVDAVHYAPHFSIDVQTLCPDFLLCSAYKFYGPHVGILYTRPGLMDQLPTDRLRTQIATAPHRIETGTLNHASIVGVKAALEYIATFGEGNSFRRRIASAMERISAYEFSLGNRFYEGLSAIPGITVYGPSFAAEERAPTVSFTIDGLSPAAVASSLDKEGILVWDGHFYAIRPVEVLGLAGRGGLIRVGMSIYNTESEVDRLVENLTRICSEGPLDSSNSARS